MNGTITKGPAMNKPAWAKRMDDLNDTVVVVILVLMAWKAVARLFL